jgi:hypothetical protein
MYTLLMSYKRQPEGFKDQLSKRADELRRARINRPYSQTLTQQMAYLAEDQELAEIRLKQIKALGPQLKAAPKSTVAEALVILVIVAFFAFVLLWLAFAIGGFIGAIIGVPGCMLLAFVMFGGGLNQ